MITRLWVGANGADLSLSSPRVGIYGPDIPWIPTFAGRTFPEIFASVSALRVSADWAERLRRVHRWGDQSENDRVDSPLLLDEARQLPANVHSKNLSPVLP